MNKSDLMYLRGKLDGYCLQWYGMPFKVASRPVQSAALASVVWDARIIQILVDDIFEKA